MAVGQKTLTNMGTTAPKISAGPETESVSIADADLSFGQRLLKDEKEAWSGDFKGEFKRRFYWRIDGEGNKRGAWNTLKVVFVFATGASLVAACLESQESPPTTTLDIDGDGDDEQVNLAAMCSGLVGAFNGLKQNQTDFATVEAEALLNQDVAALQADLQAEASQALEVQKLMVDDGGSLILGLTNLQDNGELIPVWAVPLCSDGEDGEVLGFISPDLKNINSDSIQRNNGSIEIFLPQAAVNLETGDVEVLDGAVGRLVISETEAGEQSFSLKVADVGMVKLNESQMQGLTGGIFIDQLVDDVVEAETELSGTPAFPGFNSRIETVSGLPIEDGNGNADFWVNSFELQGNLNEQGFAPVVVRVEDDNGGFNALSISRNGDVSLSLPDRLFDPYDVDSQEDLFVEVDGQGFALYGNELDRAIRELPKGEYGDNIGIAALVVTETDKMPEHLQDFKAGTVVIAAIDKTTNQVLSAVRAIYEQGDQVSITLDNNGFIQVTAQHEDGSVTQGKLTVELDAVVENPDLPAEFTTKFPNEEGYAIEDGKAIVDGEVWYELEDGQWAEKLWVYDSLTSEEIAALELEGSYWGVVEERSPGVSEDHRVAAIRGKVVREYRKTIDGVTFVVIDMLTKIENTRKVLPQILGTDSDDGTDLACYFRGGSSPEGSGLNCSAQVVIDNVELGDVVVAEVWSSQDEWEHSWFRDNPGAKFDGLTHIRKYVADHYKEYKSLMDKIISGNVASITPEEAELLLGVFELDIE